MAGPHKWLWKRAHDAHTAIWVSSAVVALVTFLALNAVGQFILAVVAGLVVLVGGSTLVFWIKDRMATAKGQEGASGVLLPEAPRPRHRTLLVGDRVMNHEGTECLYYVSDPDGHTIFHEVKSDEERVHGVTARLNRYFEEALTLARAERTTYEEWSKWYWQDFHQFVMKHMAIRRQTESMALSTDQPGIDRGSPQAARSRFQEAADLIDNWLEGRGLTRFDLREKPTA